MGIFEKFIRKVMRKIFLLPILFISINLMSQAIFIGPMVHYNFGAEKKYFSYGIEASVWYQSNIPNFPLYGLDFGYEFDKTSKRVYSELQIGIPSFGISNGVVMEWSKDQPKAFGYQGSIWFAVIGGVDFRYRNINNSKTYAPGVFGKGPVYLDGRDFYFD
jgi:hypothetical protein